MSAKGNVEVSRRRTRAASPLRAGFGYVLEGRIFFELEGEEPREIVAGEAFWEPGGDVMHSQVANLDADTWARFIVVCICAPGVGMITMLEPEEIVARDHLRHPSARQRQNQLSPKLDVAQRKPKRREVWPCKRSSCGTRRPVPLGCHWRRCPTRTPQRTMSSCRCARQASPHMSWNGRAPGRTERGVTARRAFP